ncbi:MAG: transcription antitermination factor NusB, partial [Bowdeniella nasicola]|nr:transcription antitermination factor NusB [Bowdeniella nasicola]
MSFTHARRLAIETLLAVDVDDAYANLHLPKLLATARLEPRDAAYATELTYGTCRLTGRYDAIVRELTGTRSIRDLDPPVRAILRVAIHDMLALKTPPHAAVDQAVEATRYFVGERATGFVNGVLRAVEDTPLATWRERIITGKDGISHWYSHPRWLVRELSSALAAHGRPTTEVVALLAANNTAPLIDLAVRKGDRGALMAEVPFPLRETTYSPVGLQMKFGNPGRIREVRRGAVAVQDEASQLMALLAESTPVDGRDTNWLDMCAAPGGKSGLLAAAAVKRGATLRANDISAHRVKLIESTLSPLFSEVELTCADGRTIGQAQPGHYDRILLDAPCTGAGALRRRPESRWRKRASDLTDLTA